MLDHPTAKLHELSRPKLAAKARLRFDRHEQRFLLLFPERGLLLNGSASEMLHLCTGERTIQTIVSILADRHRATPPELIVRHVLSFLTHLQSRGLIQE